MDFSQFLSGFVAGLLSSFVAGAALLYLGYRFVESKLRLQDASDRRRELDMQHEQNRASVLGAVHADLESAAALLQMMLKELPTEAIPYPGFDLNGWPLVSQAMIFTTLQQDTIEALTHAYNRMKTANDQLEFLADLNHGPTAILVNAVAAGRLDNSEVLTAFDMFREHRDATRQGVIERLTELKPHIDRAIDRVEADTRRAVERPASQRRYLDTGPVGLIDVPNRPRP